MIVDVGRIASESPLVEMLACADLVVMVARPTPSSSNRRRSGWFRLDSNRRRSAGLLSENAPTA